MVPRFPAAVHRADQQLAEIGVAGIVEDHADEQRTAAGKAARQQVRAILQFPDGVLDTGTGGFAHHVPAIEHARDRHLRHAGKFGNFLDRRVLAPSCFCNFFGHICVSYPVSRGPILLFLLCLASPERRDIKPFLQVFQDDSARWGNVAQVRAHTGCGPERICPSGAHLLAAISGFMGRRARTPPFSARSTPRPNRGEGVASGQSGHGFLPVECGSWRPWYSPLVTLSYPE